MLLMLVLMPLHVLAEEQKMVFFDANGANAGEMDPQIFEPESTGNLKKCAYTRTGYTFSGWNTNADGTGTSISEEASVTTLKDYGTNPILYAQWTLVSYKITYNLDGGAMPAEKTNPAEYTVATDTFTLNNPERTGYSFRGWEGSGIDGYAKTFALPIGSLGDRQ